MAKVKKEDIKIVSPFRAERDVSVSLPLTAGKYVVIPMTFQAGGVSKYWLSVSTTALGVRCVCSW
jgi:hypothetical protein